jgi:hypothetical protein
LNLLYSWFPCMEVPTLKHKDSKFSSFDFYPIFSIFPLSCW